MLLHTMYTAQSQYVSTLHSLCFGTTYAHYSLGLLLIGLHRIACSLHTVPDLLSWLALSLNFHLLVFTTAVFVGVKLRG